MFINFWYAAALSAELIDRPLAVRMLGQNFVLFRDPAGTPHCLSNVCVHRYGPLAAGWLREGRIVCPYHGWEFDGAGRCQRIPSLGPDAGPPPTRARVDAYPTCERYGIVFVFLGDLPEAERPPLMPVPEWGDPAWRCTVNAFEIGANYQRLVENALDFAHAEFVHFVGRKGMDPGYRVPDYEIVEHDWGATAAASFPRQARGLWRYFSDPEATTRASNTFHGPAQFVTRIRIDERMWTWQYVFETPIDEYRTRSFLLNARNFFTSALFDRISDRRNAAIVREDQAILERLEPALPAEAATADLSVRTDAIQFAYRRRLQQWQQRGWRIDAEALHRERPGARLQVLPSPARRESGNWVFDTVPLCSADRGVESAAGR
jgi:phenylpropionate dioxygenase-like ring-hydroxylating dioxygenase large terminal subunit